MYLNSTASIIDVTDHRRFTTFDDVFVKQDRKISGILVKRNFNYHIMAPSDLPTYTDLAMSTVTQRQSVAYSGTLSQLQYYLNQLSADVEKVTTGGSSVLRVFGGAVSVTVEQRSEEKLTSSSGSVLRVFGSAVPLAAEEWHVIIEWVANPVNDMFADAVLAVVLKANTEGPKTVAPVKVDKSHFNECLMELLGEMFGSSCVDRLIRGERLKLVVDRKDVWIDLRSLSVQCDEDEVLQQMVSTAVTKLHRAITPVKL